MMRLDRLGDPRAVLVAGLPTRRQLLAAFLLGVLVCTAAAIGLWWSGCRWFVVETPSMATAAPVGSLVVTAPTRTAQAGDVIAFRPPGLDRVYTHRVVAVTPSGAVRTKGDLNGADDAWTTPADRIVGRAVLIVPAVGFLARAVPLLIVGGVLIWQATSAVERREVRAALRVGGLHVVASLVLLVIHPLTSIELLATETGPDGLMASVVSTGLLPVTLTSGSGSPLAHLEDGRLAVVPLPSSSTGHLVLNAVLDLDPLQHGLLVGATLLPAVLLILIGLPTEPFAPAPRNVPRSRRLSGVRA